MSIYMHFGMYLIHFLQELIKVDIESTVVNNPSFGLGMQADVRWHLQADKKITAAFWQLNYLLSKFIF
jgi:hypothetical protein